MADTHDTLDAVIAGCPFCGRAGIYPEQDTQDCWHVLCGNAQCNTEVIVYGDSDADAIANWNTRAALRPPQGWRLVPEEMTTEMRDALRIGSRRDCPSDELCEVRYVAMLAAAPTPGDETLWADDAQLTVDPCYTITEEGHEYLKATSRWKREYGTDENCPGWIVKKCAIGTLSVDCSPWISEQPMTHPFVVTLTTGPYDDEVRIGFAQNEEEGKRIASEWIRKVAIAMAGEA